MKSIDPANIVGLREWVDLPQLGIIGLRAKIDTGASTSSLHASDIQPFERDGQPWVRFTAYLGTQVQRRHRCEAPLVSLKTIKSSNGHSQARYVISTRLTLGRHSWPIELTLACRKTMRYRMLLGCKALVDGRLLVDPARSYVQNKPLLALGDA
ncbi:retropepsin-like aspartic endopeptidase RimB [Pseudomonas fluvialis]|uniref:retropepsin-like aspartic endopeptidase RimB n=1 Tax=Pseudomonas fluvialis TaxID=1793966 RepID=UPI0035B10C5A